MSAPAVRTLRAPSRSPNAKPCGFIAEVCGWRIAIWNRPRRKRGDHGSHEGARQTMAVLTLKAPAREVTAWDRLKVNRDWLALWFMLPAAAFLLLFLAYPLGLGVWLSFTDARIGR